VKKGSGQFVCLFVCLCVCLFVYGLFHNCVSMWSLLHGKVTST
jgi:hypothetical protein